MTDHKSTPSRPLGILAALVVALFLAYLYFAQSPETNGLVTQQAGHETTQSEAAPAHGGSETATAPAAAERSHLTLMLKDGAVEIELFDDLAPNHAERLKTLAAQGFYNGIVFHRVIDGFMTQTGDPTGTGMGGSDLPDLQAEFNATSFERGVVGMARSQDPDSANSQFFIMLDAAPHLNGGYTAIGRVVSGMEYVDAIKKGDPTQNGLVTEPDRIVSLSVR